MLLSELYWFTSTRISEYFPYPHKNNECATFNNFYCIFFFFCYFSSVECFVCRIWNSYRFPSISTSMMIHAFNFFFSKIHLHYVLYAMKKCLHINYFTHDYYKLSYEQQLTLKEKLPFLASTMNSCTISIYDFCHFKLGIAYRLVTLLIFRWIASMRANAKRAIMRQHFHFHYSIHIFDSL